MLLFLSPPSSGVLRDMRHQLLPEGDLFFCRIVAIPPFPHFIVQIFPSFYVLLLGRILSGVSTSCLYSVFEVINPTSRRKKTILSESKIRRNTFQSWYVAEHKARGLPNETLSSTLALVGAR